MAARPIPARHQGLSQSHYYGADVDSTSIFVASVARFARICGCPGESIRQCPHAQAGAILELEQCLSQGDSTMKCWAAAELWRLDQTITSAKPTWKTSIPTGSQHSMKV
jgi:hypothetical protein